ncbi:MAG: cell cycle protein [Bacteroidetes bacterium]|nr:cell cycle protein [Bacteroidota bacterium]MBP1678291.1 cell cycle protein [Bacteroidota bacterium]
MTRQRNHIDLMTLLAVVTLMVLSLGVVYSASATWAMVKWGESGRLLGSHALKVLLGFVFLILFIQVDYHKYRKLTKPALVAAIVLLLFTLGLGGEVKGAARWLRFGGFSLQPSEFAKFALIFHLAVLMAEKKERIAELKFGYVPLMLWVGSVTVLVLLQPNFSTGVMIFLISLIMLFVGRARVLHLGLTVGALLPLLAVYMLSAEYRMRRIVSYIDGSGGGKTNYQLWQAMIGFGNGGVFGLGPGNSRQRDLFLPESYGDFVFSIVGEEYGLIGTLFIVGLFLLITLRGIRIARHAPDDLGRYLALGVTAAIACYGLVNGAVTLGILPTTGLPMPFISFGGSSMLFSAAAVGVLLNVSSQTDLHPRAEGVKGMFRKAKRQPAVGSTY